MATAEDDAMQADTSVELAGNDGGDGNVGVEPEAGPSTAPTTTTAPAPSSSPSTSLSPHSFAKWIRSAERKLLSTAAAPSDVTLDNFRSALETTQSTLLLSAHNWRLYCALSLWNLINRDGAGGATLTSPEKVLACLDLHESATRSSSGSALELSVHLTYIHLLLQLHYDFEGLPRGERPSSFWQSSDDDEDASPPEWRLLDSINLLKDWTGLTNAPHFLKLHHRTTNVTLTVGYDTRGDAPMLRVPTRATAGQEDVWDAVLGETAVRTRLRDAAARTQGDSNWSSLVWDQLRDFELVHLQRDPSPQRIDAVKQLYMDRLCSPHRRHEVTAQAFSTFLSTFCPPQDYEQTMVAVQQGGYTRAKDVFASLEPYEDRILALANSEDDEATQWQVWRDYFRAEAAVSPPLFERAVAFLGIARTMPVQEETEPPVEKHERDQQKGKTRTKRDERLANELKERETYRDAQTRRESLWTDYVAHLAAAKAHPSQLLDVLERAVRMVPGSGRLWATYVRHLSRMGQSADTIAATFTRAIEGGECTADDESRLADKVESRHQVVELLLSRIEAERQSAAVQLANEQGITLAQGLAALPQDANRSFEVYAVIQYALEEHAAATARDTQLRVQRLATAWLEAGVEGMSTLAVAVWDKALEQQPNNPQAYIEAAAFYTRQRDALGVDGIRKARSLYSAGASRSHHAMPSSDRVAILSQWRQFEAVWGSAEDILKVEQRFKREQDAQWDAWVKQQHEYAQWYGTAAATATTATTTAQTADVAMSLGDADGDAAAAAAPAAPAVRPNKRKGKGKDEGGEGERDAEAEALAGAGDVGGGGGGGGGGQASAPAVSAAATRTASSPDGSKRGRRGDTKQPTRDRENSSILVSNLPEDATRDDIAVLFGDCGSIRELSGPTVVVDRATKARTAAGVVEFTDRTAISSARTKDQSTLRGHAVHVALGWECTLYVTNFPADTDDFYIRNMFGRYGTLYDVRWPNKKVDPSRRFCYVQYTSARSAQEAQGALHNFDLGEDAKLQVLLSDPSRRKQRTDAHANEREIFITGIPRSATEEQVRSAIEAAMRGNDEDDDTTAMTRFQMPFRPNGKPQGIAFADFKTPLDAQRAVGVLNGSTVNGAPIKVQISRPKKG